MVITKTQPICPSKQTLTKYCQGFLLEIESEMIASHLENCNVCESILINIDEPHDLLIDSFRGLSFSTFPLTEPGFRAFERELDKIQYPLLLAETVNTATSNETIVDNIPSILEPYQIISVIGQGATGVVFHAKHKNLEKEVSLKILLGRLVEEPQFLKRFYSEMKSIGSLSHTNIVQASDAGEKSGFHYLTMEYIKGIDLSCLIKSVGSLDVADACEIIQQSALGLQYIYEQNMIHRDIKPSNLMVDINGTVKILDLGLAKYQSTENETTVLTNANNVLGTLDYMPPEQVSKTESIDIRSDIYSLGCTFYRLLTNQVPLEDQFNTPAQRAIARCNDPVPLCNELRPDISDEIANILAKMLAIKKEDRYETPSDVVKVLSPFCKNSNLNKYDLKALYQAKVAGRKKIKQHPESHSDKNIVATRSVADREQSKTLPYFLFAILLVLLVFSPVLFGLINFDSADKNNTDTSQAIPVSRPPIALDNLKVGEWCNLLNRPPKELIWPSGDNRSHWNFVDKKKQLFINCGERGLLELGNINKQNYVLEIGLDQTVWTGDIGFFWGYKIHPKGHPLYASYQFIHVRPTGSSRDKFQIVRGVMEYVKNEKGTILSTRKACGSEPLGSLNGEQLFQITVIDGKLESAKLGVRELLAFKKHNHKFPNKVDYHGRIGILVNAASCFVRKANFKLLKPPNAELKK